MTWDGFDAAERAIEEGHPMARLLRLRAEAADYIDQLIDFLDRTDGCCDRESDGSDPTMTEICHAGFYYPAHNEDDEPSLGWSRSGAVGNTLDLEEVVA